MRDLINLIIGQTRKNGNLVLKSEQITLLERFRDFDISSDWMEGKDITKIEKLLFTHLKNVLDITAKIEEFGLGVYSLIYYGNNRLDSIISPESYTIKRATEEQVVEINRVVANARVINPIVEKWVEMRDNRAMTNGKLPKAAQLVIDREAIKGALNPQIKSAIDKVLVDFKIVMIEYYTNHFNNKVERAIEWYANNYRPTDTIENYEALQRFNGMMRHWSDVMISRTDAKTKEQLAEMAQSVAKSECDSFFFKMADKLGGMNTTNLLETEAVMMGKSTSAQSRMTFKFDGEATFTIINKIVQNCSPLGNPYYQYPSTFHDMVTTCGTSISNPSEFEVKKAFNVK